MKKPLKNQWIITYPYGKLYKWGFHKGVDLKTKTDKDGLYPDGIGMPVYASADGEWKIVGYDPKGGKYVKLRHLNNIETLYFHLDSSTFKEGWKKVNEGDIIGYSGNSGSQLTGAHLHFEVRKDGVAVDPFTYLKKESSKDEILKTLDKLKQLIIEYK